MPVAKLFSVLNKLLAFITSISSLSHRHDVRGTKGYQFAKIIHQIVHTIDLYRRGVTVAIMLSSTGRDRVNSSHWPLTFPSLAKKKSFLLNNEKDDSSIASLCPSNLISVVMHRRQSR